MITIREAKREQLATYIGKPPIGTCFYGTVNNYSNGLHIVTYQGIVKVNPYRLICGAQARDIVNFGETWANDCKIQIENYREVDLEIIVKEKVNG